MKARIFYVPQTHFQQFDDKLVFRHMWLGQDVFWIVPMLYVIRYGFKDARWRVVLSEAYFEQSTNTLAA